MCVFNRMSSVSSTKPGQAYPSPHHTTPDTSATALATVDDHNARTRPGRRTSKRPATETASRPLRPTSCQTLANNGDIPIFVSKLARKFGRVSAKSGQFVDQARPKPKSGSDRISDARFWPSLPKFGQVPENSGQFVDEAGPKLANHAAQIGRSRARLGQHQPKFGQLRPNLAEPGSNLTRAGKHRPNLVEQGIILANDG